MLKCILLKSIPAAGKSTWAKSEIAKDPLNWIRINNDEIRAMANGSVWSAQYEKIIRETRNFLIKQALQRDLNVIIDNLNLNERHWDDALKICKEANKDINIFEKMFYVELEEAIERDSKREGSARVGETVVKKWWKESGGKQFQFYQCKNEIFTQRNYALDAPFSPAEQNEHALKAVIVDLDGTLALFAGKRSPYDASTCDQDDPNLPVIECVKAMHHQGYKILFVSGREDTYREPTIRFIEQHVRVPANFVFSQEPETRPDTLVIPYQLWMRKEGDCRKDTIIKEEIYREHIEGKYFIRFVLDDRKSVVEQWRSLGLVCFQVAPGDF